MTAAPLILTPEIRAKLAELRDAAARNPFDAREIMRLIETAKGRDVHMARMTKFSMTIPGPTPFYVTFSVETGHPVGVVRHLSMSVGRPQRLPSEAAVLMVAEELGFTGGLLGCSIWNEQLAGGGRAVNAAQPVSLHPATRG